MRSILWKLSAEHRESLLPSDLTSPRTAQISFVLALTAAWRARNNTNACRAFSPRC